MYQAQVNEYKYEIERLNRDLQDVKKRYFDHKRREQLEKERALQDGGNGPEELATQPADARFAGGGFNLATN